MIAIIISIITNIFDIVKHHKDKDPVYKYVADVVELVISIILFILYIVMFIYDFNNNTMSLDQYILVVLAKESAISAVLGVALGIANKYTMKTKWPDGHEIESDTDQRINESQNDLESDVSDKEV